MSKELIEAINTYTKDNKNAKSFLVQLMAVADVYLFGGGVRDFLDGNFNAIRDLDFVLKTKSDSKIDIECYIPKKNNIKYNKNRFGGYKIYFDNLIIDVWNIEDTWLFKNHKIQPSAKNLINSVYLNIDALLYLLNEEVYLYDCDKTYNSLKETRLLDIISKETPFEELNLLRAMVFKRRYSLNFSNRLKERFEDYIKKDKDTIINYFMDLQKEHYNNYILSKEDVYMELNSI